MNAKVSCKDGQLWCFRQVRPSLMMMTIYLYPGVPMVVSAMFVHLSDVALASKTLVTA